MRSVPISFGTLFLRCDLSGTETSPRARPLPCEKSGLEAGQRAEVVLERGDMDGGGVWKRIVTTVEEIERTQRRQDEAAH